MKPAAIATFLTRLMYTNSLPLFLHFLPLAESIFRRPLGQASESAAFPLCYTMQTELAQRINPVSGMAKQEATSLLKRRRNAVETIAGKMDFILSPWLCGDRKT